MCFVENIDFDGKSGFTYASEFGIGYYDLSKGLMLRFSYAKSYATHQRLQISRHRGKTAHPDQRRPGSAHGGYEPLKTTLPAEFHLSLNRRDFNTFDLWRSATIAV